jgi:hypothetical protein
MHYIQFKKWWDTKTFNQAGSHWMKDNSYCPFPKGTPAYKDYWDEQMDYIDFGYVHEGQRIPGLMYLYLNYCPIKDKKKKMITMPDFWVYDVENFLQVETLMGLNPGPVVDMRPHVFEESKSRQVGASLKGCVPILYNMCFLPQSQNFIGAWLLGDAQKTCKMFLNYFYHCQKFTEFGKRFIKNQYLDAYMTGYFEDIDGEKVPSGFQSELNIISFKDNVTKGVGGGIDIFVIEEAGLHPDLIGSLKYLEPACKDGDYTTGGIIAYGAAGKQAQSASLEKVHNNPEAYKAMAYDNIWDPESPHKKTGFFIPNYACRKGHMDIDGNPNPETAIIARNKAIELLEKTDYEAYLLEIAQYPNNATEMFSNRGRKRFNTKLIQDQINFVLGNGIRGAAVELLMDPKTKKVNFNAVADNLVIREYPLKPGTDKTGCPEIFEFPDPYPPDGLYIGSIDSYNQEDSYYSTSLGSCIIYKTVNNLASEGTSRIVVAEYAGRPEKKEDFYKNCADLIKLFNAVVMPENEDQELTPWFINNGFEDLLADQPDIIRGYIPYSKVKRVKGIHGDIHLIIPAENKIGRYIDEDLGVIYDDEGAPIKKKYGVSRILSLGLLFELLNYVHDNFKNFDRVRTLGWTFMMEEETYLHAVTKTKAEVESFLVNTKRFGTRETRYGKQFQDN